MSTLLNALEGLLIQANRIANGDSPHRRYVAIDTAGGICGYVSHVVDVRGYRLWAYKKTGWFKSWPQFSGIECYPIPPNGTAYEEPEDAFEEVYNLWVDEQLELRISLIKHLIKEVHAYEHANKGTPS